MEKSLNSLVVKSIGIDTYRENIIYMRADCHICLSEGFTALTRVIVQHQEKSIVATLNVVHSELLRHNQAGLSQEAQRRLNVKDGDTVLINHLQPIESLSKVRAKMYRKELSESDFTEI